MRTSVKDPILLENRTKAGPTQEKRTIQKVIVSLAGVPAIAAFIVPGLDHRSGWSNMPWWLPLVGDLLILVGMWMVYRVFKENSYGSATIEVASGQKVISRTRSLRHCAKPDVCKRGSIPCRIVARARFLLGADRLRPTVLGLVWRLLDEERFLSKNLSGYTEYCGKVKYHLIPFVW